MNLQHIESLNQRAKQLNTERQRQLGVKEAAQTAYDRGVQAFKAAYGVDITPENMQGEIDSEVAAIQKQAEELQRLITSVETGEYRNAVLTTAPAPVAASAPVSAAPASVAVPAASASPAAPVAASAASVPAPAPAPPVAAPSPSSAPAPTGGFAPFAPAPEPAAAPAPAPVPQQQASGGFAPFNPNSAPAQPESPSGQQHAAFAGFTAQTPATDVQSQANLAAQQQVAPPTNVQPFMGANNSSSSTDGEQTEEAEEKPFAPPSWGTPAGADTATTTDINSHFGTIMK